MAAGAVGALLGLGGGILIVPLLSLGFGFPLATAVGTSLVCLVATSASAASHYLRVGSADVRLGLSLGVGSVAGAVVGGLLSGTIPERWLAAAVGLLTGYAAVSLVWRQLGGSVSEPEARSRPALVAVGSVAGGLVSSLLGVGGGLVQVPVMRLGLGRPMHVATATSAFVISITGAAGAWPYLLRGNVDLPSVGPLLVGVVIGAVGGARLAGRLSGGALALVFAVVLGWVAFEMATRAVTGP